MVPLKCVCLLGLRLQGSECKGRGPQLGEGFILYPRVKGIFTCGFGSKRDLAHPSEALNSREVASGIPESMVSASSSSGAASQTSTPSISGVRVNVSSLRLVAASLWLQASLSC